LFISHSGRDSIEALAFQRWLESKGWSKDDVFIDLHDMQAGERWRETLVKANVACEALLYLASPEALDSEECRREVRRAEDDRKDVIVAILRDVTVGDPRLAGYAERQIMDLSTHPREERVEVEHKGQRHLIDFNRAALNAIHTRLIDWGIAPDAFAWPPRHIPKAQPYPGLDAFDEHSAGIFFGREAEVMAGIRDLRQLRHRGSPRLLVIQAASGAGKSSFLRAGLWPRLGRTAEFVPLAVLRPATGIVTGQHGLGQGLARWFGERRRQIAPGTLQAELMAGDAAAGAERLAAHMIAAVALVAEERGLSLPQGQAPARLSPLIAIDQGEELFATEDAGQSDRFLDMMGRLLGSLPAGLDPYVLATIRADSVDALLQRVPALGVVTPHTMMLPPLSPAAYRDVVTRPAAVYTRQVARLELDPELVEALVEGASGADALPLLAFTLQRLFIDYAPAQMLTRAHYDAMGGIEGSIDRKLNEAKARAGAAGTDAGLRRLIVPALATWDGQANAAKRLVPMEAEVVGGDRAPLAVLADALVEARLLTRGGGTLEVAHEALLRRQPISGWLEEQKDALKLRDDVLREANEWEGGGRHADGLVRRGARLEATLALQNDADFSPALTPARDYLGACRALETAGQRRARRATVAMAALMLATIAGLLGVIFKEPIGDVVFQQTTVRNYVTTQVQPHVLTAEAEGALKPGSTFRECANDCPEMVVVPAGTFRMGSPTSEVGHLDDESPVHPVTIAKPLAVGKFEVTWYEWEACVAMRGCDGRPTGDATFGKERKPVINVTWHQAKSYVKWLSSMTRKEYRLLTEAEWEYAARAGRQTAYSFGDDAAEICRYANLADQSFRRRGYGGDIAECDDNERATASVGSYLPNAFGLHDMHGNVWEWVEDCYVANYNSAPDDGTAQLSGMCYSRVLRGGSWNFNPRDLRAAARNRAEPGNRTDVIGFRVARVLSSARTLLAP
jgi:formylglycine-generating enzyme required for sulfatase activity